MAKQLFFLCLKKGMILFLTFSILAIVGCKKKAIDNPKDFEKYLKKEMKKQHIPALSAVVFKADAILYEGYLGQSNIANDKDLLATDMFLLASISKTITATALMQLYEDGLFELTDNVNDYLPFAVNVPDATNQITFKMLLTHTSAIADGSALDDQYYYGVDSPVELGYFLENYLVPGGEFYTASENFYDFDPGTDFEYSNIGNALIGLLVQEISGQNFNTYCKENIFIPLGMTHTFWRLDEIAGTIVQPYNYSSGDYSAIEHYTFTDYPNGGLRSTGLDMFRFLSAYAQNGSYGGYEMLKPETVEQILTLQIPAIEKETGLHFFIMNKEYELWGHDGGEQGVATIMGFNKTTKVGALLFTNQGEVKLEKMLAEAYKFGLEL